MDHQTHQPNYARIAADVASRIRDGEFPENSKIYGRSVMSGEYGVSPETIRRSMKLLEDLGVVEVRQNSCVVVLSREKAMKFIERYDTRRELGEHRAKLRELIAEQDRISRQIAEEAELIISLSEKFSQKLPPPTITG